MRKSLELGTGKTGICLAGMLVMLISACGTIPAAYRIDPAPMAPEGSSFVTVITFEDTRTDEEKRGAGAGFLNKSTKDTLYDEPVNKAITGAFIDELKAAGVNANSSGSGEYIITGKVTSYRAKLIPPPTAKLPYIRYATWILNTKDTMKGSVGFTVSVTNPNGEVLSDQVYAVNSDSEAWVGVMGLASTARRWDRPALVRMLRESLKNLLKRAAADAVAVIRED